MQFDGPAVPRPTAASGGAGPFAGFRESGSSEALNLSLVQSPSRLFGGASVAVAANGNEPPKPPPLPASLRQFAESPTLQPPGSLALMGDGALAMDVGGSPPIVVQSRLSPSMRLPTPTDSPSQELDSLGELDMQARCCVRGANDAIVGRLAFAWFARRSARFAAAHAANRAALDREHA